MQILPISVVIITHNEEANIERAIRSVMPVCNDIVVVDSGSTDNTVLLAKSLGAKVFEMEWQGYSKQKNYGNSKAINNYVFSIDADEAFSPELCKKLISLFEFGNMKSIYRVKMINHYCNKPIKHGAWHSDFHYKFFDKRIHHWIETDEVHERLNITNDTSKGILKEHLLHYTTQSDDFYLQKMDNYASLFAAKMKEKGIRSNIFKAYSSASFRFLKEYFLQLGFMDGSAGYKIASAHFIYTIKKYLYLKN